MGYKQYESTDRRNQKNLGRMNDKEKIKETLRMLEPSGEALLDDFIKPPVDASGKILQFISIGVAPGLVMSATSYMIARKFGSKQIGWLIIAGGLVLLIGMFYANTMIDGIEKDLRVFTVTITPPLFMAVSIPMMIVGALLFRLKKRPKKYF